MRPDSGFGAAAMLDSIASGGSQNDSSVKTAAPVQSDSSNTAGSNAVATDSSKGIPPQDSMMYRGRMRYMEQRQSNDSVMNR
jgi:hypothetical protein